MTKTIEELKQRAQEVVKDSCEIGYCIEQLMKQLIADQQAKIEELEDALKLISNPPDRKYVSDYDIANSMVGIAINVLK